MEVFGAVIFPLLILAGSITGLVFLVKGARAEGWKGSKVTGTVILSILSIICFLWVLIGVAVLGY
jgi:hypothetical protein